MVRSSSFGLSRGLYKDAIAGDADAIATLNREADELDDMGETLLHFESRFGYAENVQFLASKFVDKNLLVKRDRYGQTALHTAVLYDKHEMVRVLIDAASRLNFPPSSNNGVNPVQDFIRQVSEQGGNTALHFAVIRGVSLDIVKLLVEADTSDRHITNDDGETPIYIAARKGLTRMISAILTTTCRAQSLYGPGTTVLHAYIDNIRQVTDEVIDTIRMIIHAAKDWSSVQDPPHVSFETLFNTTDESGRTFLELAMKRKYVTVMELILQEDLAYQRGTKRHSLMRLIFKAIHKKYSKDIVKLLSETYEAGISQDQKGVVKLILAIKNSDKECVSSLLIDSKQLVSFADDEGWTPLHYAAYHGFDSVLSVIIDAQIDVGYQSVYKDGVSTPLLVAAERGYTSTLKRLMQLWPPTSSSVYTVVNKKGRNILLIAAAGNNTEMIRGILISYCPEEFQDKILKQKDDNDDTLLHLLISQGCFIPELILHKELDIMAKNKKDWTPWDMLYLDGDIIADQVHIKRALDDALTKTDNSESKVSPYKRERKDVIFNERIKLLRDKECEMKKKKDEEYLERYKNRTNTQIIVTALITTVTFTVGFTMPGGLRQSGEVDEGLVLLSRKTAFKAFMLSDAFGLLFSTCSLLFYFLMSISKEIKEVRKLSAASSVLNIVSIVVMMVTFITGTYVVLSNSPALAISVCGISSLFFLLIIVLSRNIYRTVMYKKLNED